MRNEQPFELPTELLSVRVQRFVVLDATFHLLKLLFAGLGKVFALAFVAQIDRAHDVDDRRLRHPLPGFLSRS